MTQALDLDLAPKASSCTAGTSKGCAMNGTGLYKERLRPQIHYTRNEHWLHATSTCANSHLIYPSGADGNKSSDLYNWTNHPIALAPEKGQGIFSGSAVVDKHNTSGFFDDSIAPEDRIVAIYTLNTPEKQTQDIAYSTDGGFTFTKYENNPVIDLNTKEFRDPNVQWHEPSGKWIMTVALPQLFQVVFYGSDNLRTWTELSRFGEAGILGLQYECPDLVEVPIEGTQKTKWCLILSVNPGMPLGGSATQYFLGDFDGTKFTPDNTAARLTDFAKDNYAGITYKGAPGGHPLLIAWASNWQYTNVVPTSPWRSSQTLARRLSIRLNTISTQYQEYALVQEPVDTSSIQGATLYTQPSPSTESKTVALSGDGAFDFDFTFTAPTINPNSKAVITISNSSGTNSISVGADLAGGYAYIDRAKAGTWYNPTFTDKFSVGVFFPPGKAPSVQMRGIVDRNVLELFLQNGTYIGTALFFFDEGQPALLSYKLGRGWRYRVPQLKS